jgi:hypothetical protein
MHENFNGKTLTIVIGFFCSQVGTFGVWITGVVLDSTNQDWSFVFSITAGINIVGAFAFFVLYNSSREFD